MSEAASGLVYLFGDEIAETPGVLELRVLTQTASTITLGWTPVPGALGYRFSSSLTTKFSHTFDPLRSSVRFSKGAAWYKVEVLVAGAVGIYPKPVPPPVPSRGLVASAHLVIGE